VNPALRDWIAPRKPALEAFLGELFSNAWPEPAGEMYRYPLLSGGKRMRPLWVIASNDAVAGTAGEASLTDGLMHVAAALELIHCYSLVHDDLPCMDDDDERRGRPTVHKVYGEGPAVLVGDALLTEALALALRAPGLKAEQRVAIALELTQAAGYLGMIGGQAADIGLGGKVDNQADLERLHRGKTGALIRAGCRMGGLVAGANESEMNALTRYGESIGLAFQLADDVLDAEEDAGEEGPPSFVKLMGLEACKAEADRLFNEALEALGDFQAKAEPLRQLAAYTVQRNI
jgi:geranylgeranyl pyrophosphate synthase